MSLKCIAGEDAAPAGVQLERAAGAALAQALDVEIGRRGAQHEGIPALLPVRLQLGRALQQEACQNGVGWGAAGGAGRNWTATLMPAGRACTQASRGKSA